MGAGGYGWKPLLRNLFAQCSRMAGETPASTCRAPAHTQGDGVEHHCDLCTASYGSYNQLQTHRHKAHGKCSPLRHYVFSVVCPACDVCFWTFERCYHHLSRSRCGPRLLRSSLEPMSEQEVAQQLLEARALARGNRAKGLSHRFADCPPMRAAGPANPFF